MGDYLDSWMGEAVNWECDELGHLNMRHYAAKAEQARQFLFIHLGLHHAFEEGAPSSVRTRELTICYLAEARPGARLSIQSGITRLGETDADIVHIMSHADGRRAATIQERVEHVYLRTAQPFAWPSRLNSAASDVTVGPNDIGPRGLPEDLPVNGPDRDKVMAMGCDRVGAGVFTTSEADMFGQIRPMALLGRVSESVGNFRKGFPEAWEPGGLYHEGTENPRNISGVLLEVRLHIHAYAEAGHAYEVFSGVHSAKTSVRNLVHHMVNPANGRSWASLSATSALIDLDARKLVRSDAAGLARLQAHALPGLTA